LTILLDALGEAVTFVTNPARSVELSVLQHWKSTSLFIVAMLTAPAMAQDGSETAASRTPASAQKFLASMPPQIFFDQQFLAFFEGQVASPDVCKTIMSGRAAIRDGNNIVAAPVKGAARRIAMARFGVELDEKGLLRVIKGDAAFTAGLRNGDKLVRVNGQQIVSNEKLQIVAAKLADLGQLIVFDVMSQGRGGPMARTVSFTATPDTAAGFIELSADPASVPTAPLVVSIDWSKVQQVTSGIEGPRHWIALITPDDVGGNRGFYYTVAETRDRVLAAAQYLKTACDQTKDLGF
jgi:hypothetical protein